jgi:E3 ubiquitin-protein ligase synoviolin
MANVVLARAYYERPNFYSAAVYISQSTGSLMFLVNLMLIVAASFGYGLQRLFYGTLRPIETEQLYDKAWFAVSETLLAMTIFRDDIGMWFFTMFLCLLAGKVWQWIGEGRVEFLEQQPPANPKLFHTRLISSLLLSVSFDIFMMQYCIDSILSEARPGVMVMFGFEYVLLAIASISTLLRYTLSLIELYITHRQETAREDARRVAREQALQRAAAEGTVAPAEEDEDETDVLGWEDKGRWVFYLDLATDFIKSVVYLGFFMILMTFYGIPIHIMRDLFMTIRSFFKRVHDFVQYRNATRDMNIRYPDATAEELERENTCIVCREEMHVWVQPGADGAQAGRRVDERQRAKKLPCGHILHFNCLRSWLERQQVCPTCRRPVLAQTGTQITQGNNPVDPGQQDQQNQQAHNNMLQGLLRGNQQQGGAGQQGQPAQAQPPAGQQGQPQPNMRVFNFGPFRIALGNLRIPAGQQADPNNIRNAMDQLRQQAIANTAAAQNPNQNPNQSGTQPLALSHNMNLPTGSLPGAMALHPADVQSDILRIQQNIIESLRQLNAQHEQLEVIHRLLGELNHLQQSSGVTAATGQELPHIASLNPPIPSSFPPQAFFAQGQVLRQGDAGVPAGLTLPEGWTLRPMALAPRHGQENVPIPAPSQSPQPPAEAGPSSSSAPASTAPPSGPSPKPAESSSLDSSWSFGNAPERSETEGSSSGVAGSSLDGSNPTRRTVIVEDAEDSGE